ncbi:hypothetical protein ACFPL7_00110 [Dongia soli]|uniref:Transposase n=1 Tax=Dongia soli TaxID=600628 RepID=A0ABU5EE92_9PROT|nr:hypothetical protein [Dongia soli]MDY0884487.1 hypothetical protein [Dongia soli]
MALHDRVSSHPDDAEAWLALEHATGAAHLTEDAEIYLRLSWRNLRGKLARKKRLHS